MNTLRFKTLVLGFIGISCLNPGATSNEPKVPDAPGATAPAASFEAGPYVWKSVAINGGGFVSGVIFSPVEKDLLYARTDIGGAYRFNPKEKSWIPITDHLSRDDANYMGIESMAPDPVDPNRLYMAVGTYTQSWAGAGAIMRSNDRGDSWQVTPMTIKMGGNEYGRSGGERLAVDPHKPNIVLFGSRRDSMWKSSDSGKTWQKLDTFPFKLDQQRLGIPFVVFDAKRGKKGSATPVVYAGLGQKDESLFRTKDGGTTWEAVPGQPTGVMP
jgi:photosystem II stability/assembly factor-like uncharacterized protein